MIVILFETVMERYFKKKELVNRLLMWVSTLNTNILEKRSI